MSLVSTEWLFENKDFNGKIVTKISKELNYCKAEDYHQKYLKKKGM